MGARRVQIDPARFDALIFDMDGVITDTAVTHAHAWKRLFDEFLEEYSTRTGTPEPPFDAEEEYLRYVDGKERNDGVRSFLASRGITLPEGDADSNDMDSVHGLGTRKNGYFLDVLASEGATAFESAVELVRAALGAGMRTAVISASRNAAAVLDSAGVSGLFQVRVDGDVAAELALPGKPDPAVFLEAARRLGVEPARAVVFEDAEAGVDAGSRGGFGLVVGVDMTGSESRLLQHGADVVVSDLAEVEIAATAIRDLPRALDDWDRIAASLDGRAPAVFLDYDGTLTPIVERPEDAVLSEEMRSRLRELAERSLVAVVSGRDVSFVVEQVALDSVLYLGSHGFDVVAPEGMELANEKADAFARFLVPLDRAEAALEESIGRFPGAHIERKKFAIAVHYRQAADADVPAIEQLVDEVLASEPDLRKGGGKKVFELRPDIDWDKGRSLLWVLSALELDAATTVPVYIGDDLTDEDAFSAVRDGGIGLVVGDEERPTKASWRLEDVDEVGEVLSRLAEHEGGSR